MGVLIGFVCVLLACFLWAVPSTRKLPNRFLAAFLFLTAVELSVWVWGSIEGVSDWGLDIWSALGRLQMPAFFFFFLSSCYSDFKLKRHDLLHIIPFGLTLGISTLAKFTALPSTILNLFAVDGPASALLSHVIYYGYMAAIIVLLWQFRRKFREHHSGGRSEVLLWLTQLAAVSLFAHTLVLIRDAARVASTSDAVLVFQMVGALLALAITTWIAFKSLLQPSLFRDIDRRLLQLGPSSISRPSGDIARVITFIEAERPFLNANLTLADLADQLAMMPRELSELINGSLGVHFFDFVNGYRVAHAKTLLLETPKRSVIQVLNESGFNSKSSFNTAFKKEVGLTPSAYRAPKP